MSSKKSHSKETRSLFSPLTNSLQEFEHVAWPSRQDALKYLAVTMGVIITMTIFLSLIGVAFKEALFEGRDALRSTLGIQDSIPADAATQQDLQDLLKNLSASGVSVTTGSGESASGVTVTPVAATGSQNAQ